MPVPGKPPWTMEKLTVAVPPSLKISPPVSPYRMLFVMMGLLLVKLYTPPPLEVTELPLKVTFIRLGLLW